MNNNGIEKLPYSTLDNMLSLAGIPKDAELVFSVFPNVITIATYDYAQSIEASGKILDIHAESLTKHFDKLLADIRFLLDSFKPEAGEEDS